MGINIITVVEQISNLRHSRQRAHQPTDYIDPNWIRSWGKKTIIGQDNIVKRTDSSGHNGILILESDAHISKNNQTTKTNKEIEAKDKDVITDAPYYGYEKLGNHERKNKPGTSHEHAHLYAWSKPPNQIIFPCSKQFLSKKHVRNYQDAAKMIRYGI